MGELRDFDDPSDHLLASIGQNVDQYIASLTAEAEQSRLCYAQLARRMRLLILTAGLITCIGGGLLGFWVTRSTTGAIRQITESLASGTEQTAAAAGQVSASSEALAQGASEQASSLEETSASFEEMSSMTRQNASHAQQAKQAAVQARTSADSGANQMAAMQTAMAAIQGASGEITKILKTIDEIAFQTNILALNAAVEAGMGFAVVADEVRSLAQRAAAARETASKIEDSVAKSQQGAQISGEVARSFAGIQEEIRHVDQLVGEIAAASQEQTQRIGQVTTAVSQMDKVTQGNAASAEGAAAAAQELSSQSAALKSIVASLSQLVGTHAGMVAAAADASAPAVPSFAAVPRHAPSHRPSSSAAKPARARHCGRYRVGGTAALRRPCSPRARRLFQEYLSGVTRRRGSTACSRNSGQT